MNQEQKRAIETTPPIVEIVKGAIYRMRGGGLAKITCLEREDIGEGSMAVGYKEDPVPPYKTGHWIWTGGGGWHYPQTAETKRNWPNGHPLDLVELLYKPPVKKAGFVQRVCSMVRNGR